jgi:hypothetical protein
MRVLTAQIIKRAVQPSWRNALLILKAADKD